MALALMSACIFLTEAVCLSEETRTLVQKSD